MKRYAIFGFDDYQGTDLGAAIQGTTDYLDGIGEKNGTNKDLIQILDMKNGGILEWDGGVWAETDNVNDRPSSS